ncbi:MAG TPA: RNA polymerase factor sigma-54 [Ottowia sp.]|uniref:RNA polymerase factor sigma-54 n=1 Tax=Ottowia sp. TaxID=1898956 RepID=UPI002B8FADB7|nr:RNA polymerase factor sigma-54 [Ottowia sp.]HMN22531.1 RNA polymerase factor sigma-54 [Ottowia sp.]
MKPGLSLRTAQQLALTPQLQQAIRLLQLSTLELEAEIEQMLADNPFLEREEDSAAAQPDDEPARPAGEAGADAVSGEDAEGAEGPPLPELEMPRDWSGDADTSLAPDDREWDLTALVGAGGFDGDEAPDPGERGQADESLQAHLLRQALALRLAPEDAAALRFLIESLDDDGYLPDSLAQLAATLSDEDDDLEALEQLIHHFNLALRLLQTMEPIGVGARSLAECLVLQLRARQAASDPADSTRAAVGLALRLLALPDALDWIARRDLRRMTAATGADEAALRVALAVIGTLEPKPGRRFASVEHQVIVPDVIVSAGADGADAPLRVQLNPDVLPRLRVHTAYARALRGAGDGHAALSQHLQEARWFVRNIQQRFDTILRVARAIVERQRGFFTHGELAMRPLVQRELAATLGVHESTISRVTTAKYMATPRGTYELKYFFGSALATEAGGNASSTAVRALIRQFIEAEDPARPLSDNQIAGLLKEQGIDCARRTVAKYREALKIAPAQLRRAL